MYEIYIFCYFCMSERTKSVLSFEGFPGAGGEIARRAKGKRQLRPGQAGAPKGVAARQALRLRAALARPGPPGPGHPGFRTRSGTPAGLSAGCSCAARPGRLALEEVGGLPSLEGLRLPQGEGSRLGAQPAQGWGVVAPCERSLRVVVQLNGQRFAPFF